ncbi:MAG: hypothetical protein ACUVYA_05175 [Planctomycetota bacterium]
MRHTSRYRPILPKRWIEDFFEAADLERSFEGLRGAKHFHADTMRGRIRSLQVRLEEAHKYFERAYAGACIAPKSIPNLMRELTLHAYWLENRALQGPLEPVEDEDFTDFPEFPEFPDEIVEEYPEVLVAARIRNSAEALMYLHSGKYTIAAEIYSILVERDHEERGDILAGHYIGLAASVYNVGLRDGAMDCLEKAGTALRSGVASNLTRCILGANLEAAYRCLGEETLAEEWGRYVADLECPAPTKAAFRRRTGIAARRWAEESKLLVV